MPLDDVTPRYAKTLYPAEIKTLAVKLASSVCASTAKLVRQGQDHSGALRASSDRSGIEHDADLVDETIWRSIARLQMGRRVHR